MARRIDKSGRHARRQFRFLFKGKEGKKFRDAISKLYKERQPLLGAEQFAYDQLGPGGFWEGLGADAAGMRDLVGELGPLWSRTAQGQMFDIAPIREAATRQFAREVGPGYLEGRYAAGPSSSGFGLGFGQQARDMAMDLAALEAEINAGAQQQFLTGGGANQALAAMGVPFGFEGQGLENLLNLGGGARTSEESTRVGAAPLVPDIWQGPLTSVAAVEQGGRVVMGGDQEQGGQSGGWF
jgi:hypothetical protein